MGSQVTCPFAFNALIISTKVKFNKSMALPMLEPPLTYLNVMMDLPRVHIGHAKSPLGF